MGRFRLPRAAHLGKPRPPTEEQEQRTLALWLNLHPLIMWCHVPNGGHRDPRVAAKLQGLGVKPGVPDILIFSPPPFWSQGGRRMPACFRGPERVDPSLTPLPRGIAIELKRQGATGSKLSTEQVDWGLGLSRLCGWYWFMASGAGEAIDELERLGYGTGARR
jgi:hypothetical protein